MVLAGRLSLLLGIHDTWVFLPVELCVIGSSQDHLRYCLVGDNILKLAYECSFGIIELWIQILFTCSHIVSCLSMVIVLGLYFCAKRGFNSLRELIGLNFSMFVHVQL